MTIAVPQIERLRSRDPLLYEALRQIILEANRQVEALLRADAALGAVMTDLPAYANNAAATAGGLTAGDFYVVTGSDPRQVAVVF